MARYWRWAFLCNATLFFAGGIILWRGADGGQWGLQASLGALVVTGIGNRILYKMALVPLGNHVFALAQLQTFAYVGIYFGILAFRYRCSLPMPPSKSSQMKAAAGGLNL